MSNNRSFPSLNKITINSFAKKGLFSIELKPNMKPGYQDEANEAVNKAICDFFMNPLLQAIIDDDRSKVTELLSQNPELLLFRAPKGITIESQLTWVKFDLEGESPISIAAKRKQIKMIELMLPFFNNLEQTEEVINARLEVLSTWRKYDEQFNVDYDSPEIIIPAKYTTDAKILIDLFKRELPTDDKPARLPSKLSDSTEAQIALLFNTLIPNHPVKLDDYIDPVLFLLALYKAYLNARDFEQLKYYQGDAFHIRVIGLVQSVLAPESAKIFCVGIFNLYRIYENEGIISTIMNENAMANKLCDGIPFYRPSRDSKSGLGFEKYCTLAGILHDQAPGHSPVCGKTYGPLNWEEYLLVLEKNSMNVIKALCNDNQADLKQGLNYRPT